MPPSQLKRLKSSLRENGIVRPQKSKKKKRQATKTGEAQNRRIQRNVVLQKIRETFNPFDTQGSKKSKYDYVGVKPTGPLEGKTVFKPGVTKGLGEEQVGPLNKI